ncbi:MAG TPA: iron ABC transporter permease [Chloroflexota bacterium]|nr:iron ABC transporter permease [Chloroflexota bacterium]
MATVGRTPGGASRWRGPPATLVLGPLALVVLASMVLAAMVGSVTIEPGAILAMVWNRLPFGDVEAWWPATSERILFEIRLPRVIAAAAVGASLSVAGVLYQGLLRNPLADPFIVGASGGAAVGAAAGSILIALHFTILGFGIVPLLGFVGSFLAVWVVYLLSRHQGKSSVSGLILAGFAIGSVAGALNALAVLLSDRLQLRIVQNFTWLLGGISVTGWTPLFTILPLMAVAIALGFLLTMRLNALALGEEGAARVGISVERTKFLIIGLASLLTALAVSVSGLVAFVGLMVPHAVRIVIGPNNRLLLPASAMVGAAYLALMDLLARWILAPVDLPVGILTAIVGSPFFIVLLRHARGQHEF